MNFADVRIVLVETFHPGNIGSTARAMKNMGFSKLYLVTPKSYPDQKANELAAGADDVLNNAQISESIEQALEGCKMVFATSARPRGISLPGVTPAECAELVMQQSDNTEVAILFGRENSGLTNEELLHANYHITIPANPEYSSLNLSQAVQILSYELRMKLLSTNPKVLQSSDRLATADELEQFYSHLTEVMKTINFLKPSNPTRRLQQRLRRLFNRTQLELAEITILRGFLKQILYAVNRAK